MLVRAFGEYRDFAPLETEARNRSAAVTRAWAIAREIACLVGERRSIGGVLALLVIGACLIDVWLPVQPLQPLPRPFCGTHAQ
jgi:hypothetical protein